MPTTDLKQGTTSSMREIASIWFELVLVDLRLKLLPYRLNREYIFGRETVVSGEGREVSEADLAEAFRLADRVARAARFHLVFTMSCLRRSLVLRSRLERAGIPSRLVFGACKPRGQSISGHAWLSVGGHQIDTYGSSGAMRMFRSGAPLPPASPRGTASRDERL